jgi:hypothetical protein
VLQRLINKIRERAFRRRIRRQIHSIDGIDQVNQDHLYSIVNGLAKRMSISLYKDVKFEVKTKAAYRLREERKGYFFSYLHMEITSRRGCCTQETLVLKNSKGYWQALIQTKDKAGILRVCKAQDALLFLGLAKLKS